MDKSWMKITNRVDRRYRKGIEEFLDFAFSNVEPGSNIQCPCNNCNNCDSKTREEVGAHLLIHGIVMSYTRWTHHGEAFESYSDDDDNDFESQQDDEAAEVDGMDDFLQDISTAALGNAGLQNDSTGQDLPKGFVELLRKGKQGLYPGCESFSTLSFVVKLLHLKTLNNWTNKSFDMVCALFKEALPRGETLPASYREAKKLIRDLGLGYIKIHACEFDCALFWNEYKNLDNCPTCSASRWKIEDSKKLPRKVLWYFPLKSRLQRLFVNKSIAEDMRWHKEKRVDEENVKRHPSDCEAWKSFDEIYSSFAEEARNVRLGLASDGFNPFGNMSSAYSVWPVIIVPYNLPPWKCMKDPYVFLSMIIPGPKSPGNDIDVYLRPLIDELNELWEVGIDTYDAFSKEIFRLRAAVLWTINDFPAYGVLSGWSTKGKLACPVCMGETCSFWLKHGRKHCYMDHRRFLPTNHKWRHNKKSFDGNKDFRKPIKVLSGEEILDQVNNIRAVEFGKNPLRKKRKRPEADLNHTKKSIFFELPYWKDLKLRNNLDVMHIEKNVCDNVLGTLMDIDKKTKDTWKARKDLELMGIKPELHLRCDGADDDDDDELVQPLACYNLTRAEKRKMCEFLSSIKYPDGFASNFSRCVNTKESKILGMKSHDCHIFLHRLLPLVIRNLVRKRKDVCHALIELSNFLKELCSRTLHLDVLASLEREIAITLCKFEQIFPPAFFDVMIHLLIHLPSEAKVAGPVQYRWMFFVERYLRKLKRYVRNKAHPEGSIAEGYVHDECLTFCSLYLKDIETIFNRDERNFDGGTDQEDHKLSVFASNGRLLGGSIYEELCLEDWEKARLYVLNNCEEITPYIVEHKEQIAREGTRNVVQRHELEFSTWFEEQVTKLHSQEPSEINEQLLSLARGPDRRISRYKGCNISGFRFHTKDREMQRKTQNSGVLVKSKHEAGDTDFYGVLKDIIELSYVGENRVTLFKCDWFDVSNKRTGIRVDNEFKIKITSINMRKNCYANQPYALASQVTQVFYVQDMKLGNDWQIVLQNQPRNSYDIPDKEDEVDNSDEDPYQQEQSYPFDETLDVDDEMGSLIRDDALPEDMTSIPREEIEDIGEDTDIDDSASEEDCWFSGDDIAEEDGFNDEVDNDSDSD